MDNKRIGKKIKEIRLAKKMTQSEVVGTFITRNMLSQIESGVANPSIKTLEYLAKSLDVPINELVADKTAAGNENVAFEAEAIKEGKNAFLKGDFLSAISLLQEIDFTVLKDEAEALLARCFLALAEKEIINKNYKNGADFAQKAAFFFDKGIYHSEEMKKIALSIINR